MKRWEKPILKNLALNHTKEEGIEPIIDIPSWIVPYRYCSNKHCCLPYTCVLWENNERITYQSGQYYANEVRGKYYCGKCGNKLQRELPSYCS